MDEMQSKTQEVTSAQARPTKTGKSKSWFVVAVVGALSLGLGLGVLADSLLGSSGGSVEISSDAEYNAADVMFLQMMIPHHQQAVDMVALAKTNSSNPELLDLAGHIETDQSAEIGTMREWLTAWGQSEESAMDHSHAGHGEADMGMLSDEQMAELASLKGVDFDRAFFNGMMQHHNGAVLMAEEALADGKHPELREFLQKVIDHQTTEIADMQRLLEGLG